MANHKPRYIPDGSSVEAIRGNFNDIFALINRLDIGTSRKINIGSFSGQSQTNTTITPPGNPNRDVKRYTRTLNRVQNAYVELGSWNISNTGYVNKLVCVNTGLSTDEGAYYYHFCAQSNATGGAWQRVYSIKRGDTAGPDLVLEINVSATTAQVRICTVRAW